MAVYMIIEARVRDQEKYDKYIAGLSDLIAHYGGRYLVRGGRVTPLSEGLQPERRQPGRFLILEFPSEVDLRRCFSSREHHAIMSFRHDGAETRSVLLEGDVQQ